MWKRVHTVALIAFASAILLMIAYDWARTPHRKDEVITIAVVVVFFAAFIGWLVPALIREARAFYRKPHEPRDPRF